MRLHLIAIAVALVASVPAWAQERTGATVQELREAAAEFGERKRQADEIVAMFRCAVIASQADRQDERERLFRKAYEKAPPLFADGILVIEDNTSAEFTLGRMFEAVARDYLDDDRSGLVARCQQGDGCLGGELASLALSDFESQNCGLLGR